MTNSVELKSKTSIDIIRISASYKHVHLRTQALEEESTGVCEFGSEALEHSGENKPKLFFYERKIMSQMYIWRIPFYSEKMFRVIVFFFCMMGWAFDKL